MTIRLQSADGHATLYQGDVALLARVWRRHAHLIASGHVIATLRGLQGKERDNRPALVRPQAQ